MKFTVVGTGWIRWEIIEVDGGIFAATLSDVYNPFPEMHEFFINLTDKKDAALTVDQEGTEVSIELAFRDFGNKYPFEHGQDAILTIRQSLWPAGQKILDKVPVSSQWLIERYKESFKTLLESDLDGWDRGALFEDSFAPLDKK